MGAYEDIPCIVKFEAAALEVISGGYFAFHAEAVYDAEDNYKDSGEDERGTQAR